MGELKQIFEEKSENKTDVTPHPTSGPVPVHVGVVLHLSAAELKGRD